MEISLIVLKAIIIVNEMIWSHLIHYVYQKRSRRK